MGFPVVLHAELALYLDMGWALCLFFPHRLPSQDSRSLLTGDGGISGVTLGLYWQQLRFPFLWPMRVCV